MLENILDFIVNYAEQFFQTDVARMTIAFLIAARLHRKWVKKDVAEQIAGITNAIDNLSNTLTATVKYESKRIDGLTVRVDNLERKYSVY